MIKIVFIGDCPSSSNISPDIAFVGAKCFKTVVEWIKYLQPDYYVCLNSDTIGQLSDVRALKGDGFKVVALGSKASERLDSIGVVHGTLPHPSPKNRLLNDKKYVERELKVVYDYVHDTKVAVLSGPLEETTGGYMAVDRVKAFQNNWETIKQINSNFKNAIQS